MPTSDDDARLIRKRVTACPRPGSLRPDRGQWQRGRLDHRRPAAPVDRVFPETTADASYVDAPHAH